MFYIKNGYKGEKEINEVGAIIIVCLIGSCVVGTIIKELIEKLKEKKNEK